MPIYPAKFTAFDRTPYTYFLKHKVSGKKYYGSRTAKGCKPEELWSKYFSSSKIIKNIIQEEGKDIFQFEVRKVFSNKKLCRLFEAKFLTKINAAKRDDWYNQTNGDGNFSRAGIIDSDITRKRKSLAKLGKQKSETHKRNIGISNIGKHSFPHTEETKKKISNSLLGEKNHFFGKRHSFETKEKIGDASRKRAIGRRWMKNLELHSAKWVLADQVENYKSQGYIFGQFSKKKTKISRSKTIVEHEAWCKMMKNRIWMKHPILQISKRIHENDFELYSEQGYVRGRFYPTNHNPVLTN